MTDVDGLRLAVGHRHFSHRAAPLCAAARGFFGAEGLEGVSLDVTGEDGVTLERLRAGEIDVALDVSPAMVAQAHLAGDELVIVGAMVNGIPQILTAKPEIKTVADLRGKRVHVVERGTGVDWQPLIGLLRKHGVDPDREVTQVFNAPYPTFENACAAFTDDVADARMILRVELPNVEAAGYPVLADFYSEYPPGYPQRSIVVRRGLLDARGDELAACLRALVRAYRMLRDDAAYSDVMEIVRAEITEPNLGLPKGVPLAYIERPYWAFKQMPADCSLSLPGLIRYLDEAGLGSDVSAEEILDLAPVTAAAEAIDIRYGAGEYA